MEWNVYYHNFNKKEITTFNIFKHYRFKEDVAKLLNDKNITKEEFEKKLSSELFYYFGSKSEYEIVLTSWPPHITKDELDRVSGEYELHAKEWGHPPYSLCISPDVGEKVDIYGQIKLNWNIFVNYIWSFKNETEVNIE